MRSDWMRSVVWTAWCLAGVFLLQGCTTVPVTGRRGFNVVSADQEMKLGLTSFEEMKTSTPISQDPVVNAMVQKVGKRIAAVAEKDMPDAQWEFVVFESKEANAFCLPGGKVGVYTGILPITKNEAGLATVIGHEVGHAVAHHGAERISQAMVMQAGGQLVGSAAATYTPGWEQAALVAYGLGSKVGVELPHSRKQESEADHIGLVYMARAGYEPREAVAFWQRFGEFNRQSGGSSVPSFLRTHPVDDARIRQLQQLLPEAERQMTGTPPAK